MWVLEALYLTKEVTKRVIFINFRQPEKQNRLIPSLRKIETILIVPLKLICQYLALIMVVSINLYDRLTKTSKHAILSFLLPPCQTKPKTNCKTKWRRWRMVLLLRLVRLWEQYPSNCYKGSCSHMRLWEGLGWCFGTLSVLMQGLCRFLLASGITIEYFDQIRQCTYDILAIQDISIVLQFF